ncbi:MAG: hypothetical protein NWF08_07870 [Candidatus Bathyarchaeota archaeon]|nr:hypothetical protein [Candidatus Bathyarchaeota archaeon]
MTAAMFFSRKKEDKKEGTVPLRTREIKSFLDIYLENDKDLLLDEGKGQRYTTLECINDALCPYAESVGKVHDSKNLPPDTFATISDLLDNHEKIGRSELDLTENERRYYVK